MSMQILMCTLISLIVISTSPGNANIEAKTEIVCSPGNVKLECPFGEVIKIISAHYGRTNDVTCSTEGRINQHYYTPGAKLVVSTICNDRPNYTVYAENQVMSDGDPCSGISKYLEIHYICRKSDIRTMIACSESPFSISCSSGRMISIVSANFGHYDKVTCSHSNVGNIYCSSAGSKDVISNECDNKERCEVKFRAMFGDPCYGTNKYLDVQYRCI